MIWRALTFFSLLISMAAFVIAIKAYQLAGGDLKTRGGIEKLQGVVQSTRQETANALDRLEQFVRGYMQGGGEGSRER
ncbi:MAG: hypothetical protein ACE10F_05145 [Candidatus Methylomirabilales bacterium]|nr:hypothetical protein [candidate division NC10 bacterium]MCZ6551041.1 hypothetical protein [candidate division NC10 bacterium]